MNRHLTKRQKTLLLVGCILFGPVRKIERLLAKAHYRWLDAISPNIYISPDSTFEASWSILDPVDLPDPTRRRIEDCLGLAIFDADKNDDPTDCN